MQIQVRRFREVADLLEPVVPKKPVVPLLTHVLIRNGQAMATDMSVFLTVELSEAEGECMVPFRAVLDVVKFVPGYQTLTLEQEDTLLKVTWDDGKATFATAEAKDFPEVPEFEPLLRVSIKGDRLIPVMLEMVPFCATEDKRPVLCGVTLELGEKVKVFAADGFRLAKKVVDVSMPPVGEELKSIILHADTVRTLARLWSKAPRTTQGVDSLIELIASRGQAEVEAGTARLKASFGPVSVICQTIQGTPPDFEKLIPKKDDFTVAFYAPDMVMAIRKVQSVAKAESGIVRLNWEDDVLVVSAQSAGTNTIEVNVPVRSEGGPAKVALSQRYLLEYLKDKTGMATMGYCSTGSPVVFRVSGGILASVMPMFVKWAGDPEPEPTPEPAAAVEPIPAGETCPLCVTCLNSERNEGECEHTRFVDDIKKGFSCEGHNPGDHADPSVGPKPEEEPSVEVVDHTTAEDDCQHENREDCMTCSTCGKCREDLDDNDVCSKCNAPLPGQTSLLEEGAEAGPNTEGEYPGGAAPAEAPEPVGAEVAAYTLKPKGGRKKKEK